MSQTIPIALLSRSAPKELMARATTSAATPTTTSFLTDERILLMNNMSSILAGISCLFCLIVLGFTLLVASNKDSRKYLDRVSFRLIVYALISNCIYNVGYIICVKVQPGFWCVAGVWMIQFWLGITNCLIMFIALNLQLVLVHLKNGITLEKYYLIITVVLNLATTIPPLVKGKFGWDPVIRVCWLTSPDDRDRLIWQFSTQLVWIILTVLVTIVSACITICHIYKHKFTALKVLKSNQPTDSSKSVVAARRRGSGYSVLRGATRSLLNNKEFRKIILRISLYPLVMIILNVVITVADIRISTASGIYDHLDYWLYVFYYALYGARGMFYALIAVVDPALIRGFREWRGIHGFTTAGGSDNATNDNTLESGNKLPDHIIEAKQRAQFGGINVHTQLEAYVDKEEVDPLDCSGMPMTQIRNNNNNNNNNNGTSGPTTVIQHEPRISLPPVAMVSEEDDALNDLPTREKLGGKAGMHIPKLPPPPGWTPGRPSESDSWADEDGDTSSTADLTYPDAYGNVATNASLPYGHADIEQIRLRQRQRSLQRREAEQCMKRQI